MTSKPDDLPSDLVSALAALQAEREARLRAEAVAASARAELSDNEALIAHLELRIEKLKRELYGQRSERTARLLEQLELELEELVTTAREDQPAARAVPCHAARLHRPTIAGDDPVRQVRHAYPAQPPECALQVRGDRPAVVDAGRPGRPRDLRRHAALPLDRTPCARGRAPSWR